MVSFPWGRAGAFLIFLPAAAQITYHFEERVRVEDRTHVLFSPESQYSAALFRTRAGFTWKASPWVKFRFTAQDSRAPGYGAPAPASLRDPLDLFESYVEVSCPTGAWGVSAGREDLNYGDYRLIGTARFANAPRGFDAARIWHKRGKLRLEALFLAPVRVRANAFNHPQFDDTTYGVYSTVTELHASHQADFYALRRNTRTGEVAVYGSRWLGPLTHGWNYEVEGVAEHGHAGAAVLNAGAFVTAARRHLTLRGHSFDLLADLKYASGTANPADRAHCSTFDQLYASNHDRFGHEDLFSWRNLVNARAQATFGFTRRFAGNLIYDNYWLAAARDALYDNQGRAALRCPAGNCGRHVGQEFDAFVTYRYQPHATFGTGYGYFKAGEFSSRVSPGLDPTFVYVFNTISF
jgi:hypothetical protein